ncbi:hypothetical protein DPEC_G00226660 [Dallia pectoralis]|uniref:Uncharacterized protein n=1 Tax=Dallia pectoralis TaxID=75939 RepID=A0ACC2G132_DALPE|nr:hypothetical protein DPEC_G00226660 [Dallia pectoralis]
MTRQRESRRRNMFLWWLEGCLVTSLGTMMGGTGCGGCSWYWGSCFSSEDSSTMPRSASVDYVKVGCRDSPCSKLALGRYPECSVLGQAC